MSYDFFDLGFGECKTLLLVLPIVYTMAHI